MFFELNSKQFTVFEKFSPRAEIEAVAAKWFSSPLKAIHNKVKRKIIV